jgi:hypothetical protein
MVLFAADTVRAIRERLPGAFPRDHRSYPPACAVGIFEDLHPGVCKIMDILWIDWEWTAYGRRKHTTPVNTSRRKVWRIVPILTLS